MKLSIVATLYQSAPYIIEFHQRASAAAKSHVGEDYEIVLVNDGSPDNSLDLAVDVTKSDSHVVVVDLSRNFGHHKAMMTGLAHTRGQRVFLIDSDLEEEPEWLISFAAQMTNDKCEVVYGVQERRKGSFFERVSGQLFYYIFRILTRLDMPDNIVVARLMTRRYVNALLQHGEYEVFMAGLWIITGFDQRLQTIIKHGTSNTTYTLWKKISQTINSITSFSSVPLTGIFFIGCIIFVKWRAKKVDEALQRKVSGGLERRVLKR
jgi:putative glycosyltransferase